jgi:ribosomal protein L37AE/L43A
VSHGHHLRQPVWNLHKRKVKTKTDMTQIVNQTEVESLSVDEINHRIRQAFIYDDYQYQLDHKLKIKYKNRAKKLHYILYQCPHCHQEFQMNSDGHSLWCEHCHNQYDMNVYGQLENRNGDTIFSHIPDWFEWQQKQVREEIIHNQYNVTIDVIVDSLPNSTGFYRLGNGVLKHHKDGFELIVKQEDDTLIVHKHPLENYGLHVEYDYFRKGNCLSFSTINDTYYIFPVDQSYAVTKFHFAVEELYRIVSNT